MEPSSNQSEVGYRKLFVLLHADLQEPSEVDEVGDVIFYDTQQEAEMSVADGMVEWWQQVKDGERSIGDVPEPDSVEECRAYPDGTLETVWTIGTKVMVLNRWTKAALIALRH